MMNKRKYILFLIMSATLLAFAGCGKESVQTGSDAITVEASVGEMTKATDSAFTAGDKIAVYAWTGSAAEVPAKRVVDGVVNTFDGSVWTPASLMRWAPGGVVHYFLGISPAPAAPIADLTAVPYTLDPADYAASDLLLAARLEGVKSSDGPVALAFSHVMARLRVNLKFRTQWGSVPNSVTVSAVAKSAATVNVLTKAVTATGAVSAVPVPAATAATTGYDLSFSGIQVPQGGVRKIVVSVDGLDYVYESPSDIPLVSGQQTELSLSVGRDRVELSGISLTDWTHETLPAGEVTELDFLSMPLTIEAAKAGAQVSFSLSDVVTNPVEYRTWDGTVWSSWTTYTSNAAIALANIGDKVQFRGDNARYAESLVNMSRITIDDDCCVYGNIMSLIHSSGFSSATELTASFTFCGLFSFNDHLLTDPTKPLLLPATTLNGYCYIGMFTDCTGLTVAPELPAGTLTQGCYLDMFTGCTSLTVAPELPAGTMTLDCYTGMFADCTSLSCVICLATDLSGLQCTQNWLDGTGTDVTGPKTFCKAASMNDWPSGVSGIPDGWTVQDYEPAP